MSATLSPSAVHRIICLVLDAPIVNQWYPPRVLMTCVNNVWTTIYKLYMRLNPPLPVDSLGSFELGLVLKGEVDEEDVGAIFAQDKPLEFWGCPRWIVTKIVEAFGALQKAPTYLDVTIIALPDCGATKLLEAWPEVYTTHVPCYACSTVETVEQESIPRLGCVRPEDRVETVDFAVEKFHVSSACFRKQLTVELHYQLVQGMPQTEREKSSTVHKIRIRMTNEACSAKESPPTIARRSSATLLLVPDFASEVFGFLDRAHVSSSLLANRGLHVRICQLKHRLPVHHLRCAFEEEVLVNIQYKRRPTGAYCLIIRQVQRDLSFTDVRRFTVPSTAGAEEDCTLIRRHLQNSHVTDLVPPIYDFAFAVKMLADLASRNFSIGRVKLFAVAEWLSDYRSIETIFGQMRISDFHLSCEEDRFVELVETTDFFRMSTVRGLRELKLTLHEPQRKGEKPRCDVKSKSPPWIPGICLLRNCEYYRVACESDRRNIRSIERELVQICEDFERGKITDIADHFKFDTHASERMNYAFRRENLLVSGMKVEGDSQWHPTYRVEWDVYRFRNASTSEYLTACVGRDTDTSSTRPRSVLRISKGEVYPDDYFATYV